VAFFCSCRNIDVNGFVIGKRPPFFSAKTSLVKRYLYFVRNVAAPLERLEWLRGDHGRAAAKKLGKNILGLKPP
jgi:hypothetical protein